MIFVLLCNVFCFVYLSQLFVDVKCPFFWYFLLSCLPSAFMHSLVHSLIHSSMHTSVHLLLFPVILLTVWHQRIPSCFGINYVDINLKFSMRYICFCSWNILSFRPKFAAGVQKKPSAAKAPIGQQLVPTTSRLRFHRGSPEWFGLHTKSTKKKNYKKVSRKACTLPKFNIAPENGWLEDEFPFGIPYFQGLC